LVFTLLYFFICGLTVFLAASTECSAGSNDHFVVVVVVVVVPSLVQFDRRPLLRWRNHATLHCNQRPEDLRSMI
jgi:hypothetical protein